MTSSGQLVREGIPSLHNQTSGQYFFFNCWEESPYLFKNGGTRQVITIYRTVGVTKQKFYNIWFPQELR
jgi:hypothetical protein